MVLFFNHSYVIGNNIITRHTFNNRLYKNKLIDSDANLTYFKIHLRNRII